MHEALKHDMRRVAGAVSVLVQRLKGGQALEAWQITSVQALFKQLCENVRVHHHHEEGATLYRPVPACVTRCTAARWRRIHCNAISRAAVRRRRQPSGYLPEEVGCGIPWLETKMELPQKVAAGAPSHAPFRSIVLVKLRVVLLHYVSAKTQHAPSKAGGCMQQCFWCDRHTAIAQITWKRHRQGGGGRVNDDAALLVCRQITRGSS